MARRRANGGEKEEIMGEDGMNGVRCEKSEKGKLLANGPSAFSEVWREVQS